MFASGFLFKPAIMKKLLKYLLRIVLVLFILINSITAFHAYKFTHFYDPAEITVKPKDQKSGWDITKEILFGINAVKRKNSIPDTSFQTVYLTTSGQLKIEAWLIQTTGAAKGTVILFHGHGSTKSAILTEAASFRKMGYHTFLVDFRAHGGSAGNTCTIGYYEGEEVKLAYDYTKSHGENNIVLWGISMGAAAITRAIAEYDLKPSKVILEMTFGSIQEAAGGRIKMMGLPAQPLSTLITFWGGSEHGFWAFNMKPATYAKQLHMPTLLQWGSKDPRVSRKETDLIYQNLPGEKTLVVYDNSAHESLCKKEHEKWLSSIQTFLSTP